MELSRHRKENGQAEHMPSQPEEEDVGVDMPEKLSRLELFLGGPFSRFVYTFRYLIILCGLALALHAGWWCTELRALSKTEQYFPSQHPITRAFDQAAGVFNEGTTAPTITVDVMWGLDGVGINKTGVDFYNASDLGQPIWDLSFDASDP